MKKFYDSGRRRELQSLEKLFARNEFTFAVIYGRRRVGKTSLITEFVGRGDKKAISFVATENTDTENLKGFSKAALSVYSAGEDFGMFPDWDAAFSYIAKQSNGEKLVLTIDEYPYLAKANPAVSSILQKSIDGVLSNTNIMLILCGSSMSFMEYQVLGYESPLYGRRTAQYRIMPLDYYDSTEFFDKTDPQSKLLAYAVTGGIPQYLKVIARENSVEAGIGEAYFSKDGYLYEEPQNLLKQELREPALYNAIIAAIASGATKLNEIATKVREEDSKVAKYIKALINLGIIEKESPVFSASNRSSIYRIKDGMYRFWYRFVPGVVTLIENGSEHIYENKVKPFITEYMGRMFETVCQQYLIRLNAAEELPFLFEKIGRWWGGSPITKKEAEIDIIAVDKENLIAGECKWVSDEVGLKTYKELKEKAAMFADKEIYYYLFSKSGFSSGLIEEEKKDDRLTLVDLEDLFKI